MDTNAIIEALDNEIAKLTAARALLVTVNGTAIAGIKKGPGRPKKAATVVAPKANKTNTILRKAI